MGLLIVSLAVLFLFSLTFLGYATAASDSIQAARTMRKDSI
jgi:hypothetical protein